MGDILKKWGESLQGWLSHLSTTKKVLLGTVAGLIALAVGTVVLVGQRDPYTLLYTDLTTEDVQAMSKKLGELNIPYRVSMDKTRLSVPKQMVDSARMELAKEGLPGGDVVGFERFDSATFGMSSYVQKVQFIRALQGELVRSIQRIGAVKRSRVHISIPPKKTFLEDQDPPKASVVVELHRGKNLSKAESKGIAHLVSSAVEGLEVAQVTIVDTQGKFLHRPLDTAVDRVTSTLLEMQRSIEKEYERRVVDLLTPVVGLGKVIAKVSTEMDLTRSNTTEESYDPEKTVTKNLVKTDEVSSGSRPNPIGIPGSRTNLPGTEVENPPIPMATTNSEKNSQNADYVIPKKVQRVQKPSGSIKRLTVAVVVDGHYEGAGGAAKPEEKFVPRSETELRRLRDLVAEAVGYDANRRDSITVSSLPFRSDEIPSLEEEAPDGVFNQQQFIENLIKNGLIVFVVLLFFFTVLRPFLRWATLSDVEKELALLPTTVRELEAARQDSGILSLTKGIPLLEEAEPLAKKEEAELSRKIQERLEKHPSKGFHVVEEWIESDDDEPVTKHNYEGDGYG